MEPYLPSNSTNGKQLYLPMETTSYSKSIGSHWSWPTAIIIIWEGWYTTLPVVLFREFYDRKEWKMRRLSPGVPFSEIYEKGLKMCGQCLVVPFHEIYDWKDEKMWRLLLFVFFDKIYF